MADNKYFRFGPVALTNTLTTNILSPPSFSGGTPAIGSGMYLELQHISVVNKTAGIVTFSLWVGGTGGNVAGTEVVAQGVAVGANSSFDWYGSLVLSPAQYLVGGASANTSLTIMGEGLIVADKMTSGGGSDVVFLDAVSSDDFDYLGTATAQYALLSTGVAQATIDDLGLQNLTGQWLVSGTASNYEVQFVRDSGDVLDGGSSPSGGGTWSSLGTSRTWGITATGGADKTTYATVTIRRIADSVEVASASIVLNAITSTL